MRNTYYFCLEIWSPRFSSLSKMHERGHMTQIVRELSTHRIPPPPSLGTEGTVLPPGERGLLREPSLARSLFVGYIIFVILGQLQDLVTLPCLSPHASVLLG